MKTKQFFELLNNEKFSEALLVAHLGSVKSNTELSKCQWNYYFACCCIAKGKPISYLCAKHYLTTKNTYLRTNKRWALAAYVMELILYVETNNIDLFMSRLEAFRGALKKAKPQRDDIGSMYYRAVAICSILHTLMRSDFDFKKVVDKSKYLIPTLENLNVSPEDNPVSWDSEGYELINFGNWIYNKANG